MELLKYQGFIIRTGIFQERLQNQGLVDMIIYRPNNLE